MGPFPHHRLSLVRRDGVAVITVISIVGIGLLVALAYLFGMRYESLKARHFMATVRARYLAESAVVYATELLRADETPGIDGDRKDLTDLVFRGADVDVDGDGENDARWIYVDDDLRFAVKVVDETGKTNLNCPLLDSCRVFEYLVSSRRLPKSFGLACEKILSYLKGPDGGWGVAGRDDDYDTYFLERNHLDDDRDGQVDELGEGIDDPGEYGYGDDRRLSSLEDLRLALGESISAQEMQVLMRFFSTFSASSELDGHGLPKVGLNYLPVVELVSEMMKVGLASPWQKAVNLRDFSDADFARSEVFTNSYAYRPYVSEEAPDWSMVGNYMENRRPTGTWQGWEWDNVPKGSYYCYFYGHAPGDYVGDVQINGVEQEDVVSGTGLAGRTVYVDSDGKLSLKLRFRRDSGRSVARFSYVELVPVQKGLVGNKKITGIEAVRISEVYASPKKKFSVKSAILVETGDWVPSGEGFVNAVAGGGEKGEGIWEFTGLPKGTYYVQVLGPGENAMVGDVNVFWTSKRHCRSGTWLDTPVRISDGTLRIKIQNNETEGTSCYFYGIVLSQEPDAEYVEICNLSDKSVEIGGWSIKVPGSSVLPAFVPMGTKLPARACVVLAVDGFDLLSGVARNGISLASSFPDLRRSSIVPLDFSVNMSPGLDVIPSAGALELRDENGFVVDGVDLTEAGAFLSLHRTNLLDETDNNANGNFDAWPKASSPSPAWAEQPEGIFLNRPLKSLAELMSVPNGEGGYLSKSDIARLCARLVLDDIDISPASAQVSGWKAVNGWLVAGGENEVVELRISRPNWHPGYYHLVLELGPREAVSLSMYRPGQGWEEFSPALWSDESGYLSLNWMEIGKEGLRMRLRSATPGVHLYGIHISPRYHCPCKLNLNTASDVSLLATGLDRSQINSLLSARPFSGFLGLGEAVEHMDDQALERSWKYLSVNSSSYTVVVVAQSLRGNRVEGEARLWVGVERD